MHVEVDKDKKEIVYRVPLSIYETSNGNSYHVASGFSSATVEIAGVKIQLRVSINATVNKRNARDLSKVEKWLQE